MCSQVLSERRIGFSPMEPRGLGSPEATAALLE